ncbi:T9SS type A sorting domain-containing protein, partial [Candidatus Bipolaricaulota bacterium]|nr:T9SS type A sorting domain-containing protein [Candidatus Bipolaricaulota bacterium]
TLKKQLGVLSVMTLLVVTLFALSALASDAQMYFSSDKNGQNRVTNIQEGDGVWIVVIDADQNIDCDIRDKIWPDLKIMDPKTGAYIIWDTDGYFGGNQDEGDTAFDYLEETGADTSVFVSSRSFTIGTRLNFSEETLNTHVVDNDNNDFQWGDFTYEEIDGIAVRVALDPTQELFVGRFENMDTLFGLYQDPNDASDVASAMMKIIDTKATISWDSEIYKDPNGSATIVVVDPDENLNCNAIEYVPVFILVNPGSWNPVVEDSATNFCMLKATGGVADIGGAPLDQVIRWHNIYNSANFIDLEADGSNQPNPVEGSYYVEYPVADDGNVTSFDTLSDSGITRVMFYAQETGVSTGVFQLNINDILKDLGFSVLDVRDVLVAYYLDPNDFDDFKLATAYIEERQHSITSFTDDSRGDMDLFWIGRDPLYVQLIDLNANVDPCCPEQVLVHICDVHGEDDSEWISLDETSSNSPVFLSNAGMQLLPVWDALGNGIVGLGGYQMQLDNWRFEVFNEDIVYARYNDVVYVTAELNGLGDRDLTTAFPPEIDYVRVDNDVSFDVMEIGDTQVFDGENTTMSFLDRKGQSVSGYVNSDCVFIKVVDPDQDEDQHRRERIDGYWDGGQNFPFGPFALNEFECNFEAVLENPINQLLGDTNIFNNGNLAKLYVLNPRSGRWAAVDLLETGAASGEFVSVTCIELTTVHANCVPTLDVKPGDTILAFYQDPSNHSDSAMISIKVGIGGGTTPPSQMSTIMFADASGAQVANYSDTDMTYVKVVDPSHAGATLLANAVEIDGIEYDLVPFGAADTFMTTGLDLGVEAGVTITATYVDPTDPSDSSSATITVIASVLLVESFYVGPNPFDTEVTFGFGTGIAMTMSVAIYDLAGGLVWETTQTDVSEIAWNGSGVGNGAYIYVVTATDGTNNLDDTGKVFINR